MSTQHSAMYHHLRFNHVPAIIGGEQFAFDCIEAVRAGKPETLVGCDGFLGVAGEVVESWHLEFWLEEDDAEEPTPCMWFAGCTREATTSVPHPILGPVACCERCAAFARGDHDENPVRRHAS